MLFPPIIVDLFNADQKYGIKVTYHALYACDFELNREDYTKVLENCVGFLCKFVRSWSTMNTSDEKLSVALVLRIIGNFIALKADQTLNEITGQLALENETLPTIINDIVKIDPSYRNEIFWIAGNVVKANASCRDEIVKILSI